VEPKFHTVREFMLSHRHVFLRQGSVVSTWRTYRGHRLGPFFSLRCRVDGRQTAIYLGRSVVLAERVKGLLREMQHRRQLSRLSRQARAELRRCKQSWERDLASIGLSRKGFEVRGWNRVLETGSPADAAKTSREGKP
jgi:uncharacterized protein YjiS (DUF1127 family)